ncbi:hypothetical protein KCV07_g196, partial [Aureobasidium melanogenum]
LPVASPHRSNETISSVTVQKLRSFSCGRGGYGQRRSTSRCFPEESVAFLRHIQKMQDTLFIDISCKPTGQVQLCDRRKSVDIKPS